MAVPRGRLRLGIALALVAAAGAGFTASDLARRRAPRPPLLQAPRAGGRPAGLVVDSVLPREPASLLFFQGRPAIAGSGDRRGIVTEAGSLLTSDSKLRVRPVALSLNGRVILGAAPSADGGWWISTADGRLLRFDAGGVPILSAEAPFSATALWPDSATGRIIATRSPERFGFLPEPRKNPLILILDPRGRPLGGRGRVVIPQHSLLATLANSGYAVASGDTVYFAPLSRPEVIALDRRGDPIWVSPATVVPPTPEPRIKLVDGRVRIDYQPLNLAMTLGPDGRLYVVRAVDTTVRRVRLDVIERESGRVAWRADLAGPPNDVTLAANRLGRVFALDGDRLLGAIAPSARERLPDFELPRLGGGRLGLADLSGRVVLINLWASWCTPCRTEMPALDSLGKSLDGQEFVLLAISEDQNRTDVARFVAALGLKLPVLFGDGRQRNRFGYPGLPYSVLVDGQGRIVRRWIGQLGAGDLERIRLLVRAEMARSATEEGRSGPHHHGQSLSAGATP